MVHNQPAVLDSELHNVADFTQRIRSQKGKIALHQLARHAVATSCEGMFTVQELRQLLPHRLIIRVIWRVDVNPTFEPGWRLMKEDRGLLSTLGILHLEKVRMLCVEILEGLHNDVRHGPFLQTTFDVVGHRFDPVLVQGLQSRDEHLTQPIRPKAIKRSLAHVDLCFVTVHLASWRDCASLTAPVVHLSTWPCLPFSTMTTLAIMRIALLSHSK
mmetsp:Transcript_61731/g.97864  ORF Transcript_61731/g.97864 Transcript_61731/m.97864 type:complete len:215 (-) Transcript_61731:681-1325(-)